MAKLIGMVGDVKVERWFDGVAPDSVEGATVLGYSKVGRLELALYELKNGDFCSINNGRGLVVSRRDFPQYIADEGCPWEVTDAQSERIHDLVREIQAETGTKLLEVAHAAKEIREEKDTGAGSGMSTVNDRVRAVQIVNQMAVSRRALGRECSRNELDAVLAMFNAGCIELANIADADVQLVLTSLLTQNNALHMSNCKAWRRLLSEVERTAE